MIYWYENFFVYMLLKIMLSLLFERMKRGGNLFCSGVENVELCMFSSLFYFLACVFEVFKKVLNRW